MEKVCNYCCAKKWSAESLGICCSNGHVKLNDIDEPLGILKELLIGTDPRSKHFQKNIRKYNGCFAMTSFGGKEVREGNYMPTYKVHGQIYHLIGSLLPSLDTRAQFLQIYFTSEDEQLNLRHDSVPSLKIEILKTLQQILRDNNSYVRSFITAIEQIALNKDNYKIVIHAEKRPLGEHRGRYNAPTTNEVAVLMVDEECGFRDIVLRSRDNTFQRISELHRSYDPLQYPLIFIRGEDGYNISIPQIVPTTGQDNSRKMVSCMQFYAYKLMVRENSFNTLHRYSQLFNQYCVDMGAKMITERLNFIRAHQKTLRAENYIHLRDAVNEDSNVADIGQLVILPSTFTGSPRYLHERTQDALTYVRNYGRPDLFITFTCNPEWPEVKTELYPGQRPSERHDIVARVFHLKVQQLIKIITKKDIFGKVRCYMFSIEWQKRGLPHAHILIWLVDKIRSDEIDSIISAEIPNKDEDPLLYDIVCKNMIHGPCGAVNSSSPCMSNGTCSKRYPRDFLQYTQTGDDGYPKYRRRCPADGGNIYTISHCNFIVDNKWIVPYCPILSRCFVAHVNVEYCHSVQAIKYICKYINKGSDAATFAVENKKDEVQNYLNGRYLSTSESIWRILGFSIHERYSTVVHLSVHLENGQRVYFTERNLQQVIENPPQTTLTAFFALCAVDKFAQTLLYHQVPAYYKWFNKKWQRRKRGQDVDGCPGIKRDTVLGIMECIPDTPMR
ncbi:uncharacterized protein LOC112458567 [Temnothorax curvispinosus]|uniref:Uncharacterized protein LOC112458567 n=1 Tax=Temnothorax curvispinosus TaxID=300111 RepID=A0A6J1Q733_9HYME|nr:uncharacterized protein LOC112458567 [Temnothorax curvispinosus]